MSSPAPALPNAPAPAVNLAKPEMKRTREGFGHGLVDLGEKRPEVFVLVGDLSGSTNVSFFAQKFPDRFLQVGVAEHGLHVTQRQSLGAGHPQRAGMAQVIHRPVRAEMVVGPAKDRTKRIVGQRHPPTRHAAAFRNVHHTGSVAASVGSPAR